MEMEYWQFNNYLVGYREILKREQQNIVSLAYQMASFNNSKKKPKPLKYYLDKIANSFNMNRKKETVNVDESKRIEKIIQELKKKKEVNNNEHR